MNLEIPEIQPVNQPFDYFRMGDAVEHISYSSQALEKFIELFKRGRHHISRRWIESLATEDPTK